MRATLRKLGNSAGVILPKPLLDEAGVSGGDTMDVTLEDGRIALVPAHGPACAGWAEASKRLAAAGDDLLIWREFGNAEDEAIDW